MSFAPLPSNFLDQMASTTSAFFTDLGPLFLTIVVVLLGFTGIGIIISFFRR